jgi:GntR family transcriptional regulator
MSSNPAADSPFKRVANVLREEILRGDLEPGAKLKSETDIAKRFGVTRVTARKGLALLVAEGLLNTAQGKVATVRRRPQINLLQTGAIFRERQATGVSNFNAEAIAQGKTPNQVLKEVGETPAPPEIAERLNLAPGTPVLVRRMLHEADGEPMHLVDHYYDLDLATNTPLAAHRKIKGGAIGVIEDPEGPIRRRVVQFVEDLDIRMPYPYETDQLKIPAGVPLARALRTAYGSDGTPLQVMDSRIPCDRNRFRYVINV